ncbi:hypothetical protein Val02_76710 [Virgisporangium aliadipatigenens]|uniref:Transcriptional regulator n=1 Tax=Virgisporangium aliadipatigenens TaxID=741659 RepID=A0A8J4DU02_9ACTN|nr:hypothetical protein [Virgisporangium aliadipatigenens]GIJ50785.1 hypothetical protein Val02_76710 [Virgisporangium aliadipatigenens]
MSTTAGPADRAAPLAELLRRAEWSPRQLVAAINRSLSQNGRERLRLDPTAAYPWIRRGYRPRPPIPAIAAGVLSARLGCPITEADLWPAHRDRGLPARGAAEKLDGDVLTALDDLVVLAAAPAAPIVEASGRDLLTAVRDRSTAGSPIPSPRAGREHVGAEQVDLISAHVTALRRLDDRHGGGVLSIRYITGELRNVRDLVAAANHTAGTARRLTGVLADLAQLLGWLHFDASNFGAAERYLLLSTAVSRAAGATDRAANAIGMLAYVSASRGHGRAAVGLAETALGEGSGDPVLRARLLGRVATAAAASGDLELFLRRADQAVEVLSGDDRSGAPFLYYLNPAQLAAERGQALVGLAAHLPDPRSDLLSEAVDLLRDAVRDQLAPDAHGAIYPRSALLHTSFLGRALLLSDAPAQAVDSLRVGLGLLDGVRSPRSRGHLRALRPMLVERARSSSVIGDFLPEFDRALSHHDGEPGRDRDAPIQPSGRGPAA